MDGWMDILCIEIILMITIMTTQKENCIAKWQLIQRLNVSEQISDLLLYWCVDMLPVHLNTWKGGMPVRCISENVALPVTCSVQALCCNTSRPCWSAVCQRWSPCWSQSQWDPSVSAPVGSRCCLTGTPCCTTQVQTTSILCTAPRRLFTHCKYWQWVGVW